MMMEEEIFFCDEDKDKEEMNHQLEKEIETLRTLTENGVGKRFDLYEYSQKSHKIQCWWCYSSTNQTNDEILLAKMENARVIFGVATDGFGRDSREEGKREGDDDDDDDGR